MGELMLPDLDSLTAALASVFNHNGSARGGLTAVRREPTPYVTTFPCEIVTCRFADGTRLRLFCKFAARDGNPAFAKHGFVLLREPHDEIVRVGALGSRDDFVPGCVEPTVADIFGNRPGKEEWLL